MAAGATAAATDAERISFDDRVRHLANIPGRYYLEKWRSAKDRQVSAFACRIQRISPMMMSLSAPVGGEVGDIVMSHFDEFGVLRGKIVRPLGFGFVVSLKMSDAERAKLAAKVLWFEKRKNFEIDDQRRHKRIVPRNPQSALILADGSAMPCFVIDMSVSGAAISADIFPPLGTPLALGSAVGRVVRHLNPGFAIEFAEPIDVEDLEDRLFRLPSGAALQ